TDVFAQADGLSGDHISTLFEDREGNIWVTTLEGLDRFHDAAAAPISVKQGLSSSRVTSVLSSRDGSVWVGTAAGLNRWHNDALTVYRERSTQKRAATESRSPREVHEIAAALPAGGVASIFEDRLGRIWVSARGGVGYLEHDRFVPVTGLPGGVTRSIVEDSQSLWIVNQDSGLFRVSSDTRDVKQIPWGALNRQSLVTAAAADPRQPGVWLGFGQGGIDHVADGRIRASYADSDGLGTGAVHHLRLDPDGTLWAATDGGLSRL